MSVEKLWDELWIGVKCQSNTEIAGSPRNSFRASLEVESIGGLSLIHIWLPLCLLVYPFIYSVGTLQRTLPFA